MRWTLALAIAACGPTGVEPGQGDASGEPSGDGTSGDATVRPVPMLETSSIVCKLFSNLNTSDPTANDVQHRANILGADLGIPVVHGSTLYIMFGDTIGYAGIWPPNESHPDSVGYGLDSASAIAADPSLLCSRMRMLTVPAASSIGPDVDSSVVADFAGVAMKAPSGHSLSEYIHFPSGPREGPGFAFLPGDFEVPSGAFSAGSAVYIFYTTVQSPTDITMKASYLARWNTPSTTGTPSYDILYGVDQRFDATGRLGGNFINIAAEPRGGYVYMFGTGAYRKSAVYLARMPVAMLDVGSFEVFDAASASWMPAGSAQTPIITPEGFGETSVRYFASIDRWMFLAEELLAGSNRIVARFAEAPEGPWSEAITVNDMGDAQFRADHCCVPENSCTGDQFMNCARTGFYGTYLLPDVVQHANGSFSVAYTMSSFDPYNVALFSATFH